LYAKKIIIHLFLSTLNIYLLVVQMERGGEKMRETGDKAKRKKGGEGRKESRERERRSGVGEDYHLSFPS
jgi:hypothetical protein